MKESLAIASLVVSLAANIPYVIEILQKKAQPERISWLLWTLLGLTYYFSAVFADGATFFTFGELVGPVIILVLSIKYGVGGKSRFDLYSLAIALTAFGLLFVFEGVLISLLLALIVDSIGAMLTIRKLLIDPSSESRAFWALGAIASVLALGSLEIYNAETVLFPVYVLGVSMFIFFKARNSKHKPSKKLQDL